MPIAYVPAHRAQSPPAPHDLCVPVSGPSVLLVADAGAWRLPTLAEASSPTIGPDAIGLDAIGPAAIGPDAIGAATTGLAPLGTWYGRPVWGLRWDPPAPAGLDLVTWSACLAQLGPDLTRVIARGVAVLNWRQTHRYCGACRTELAELEVAVGRICPSCGLSTFAGSYPVALIGVWRDSPTGRREVLLARHTYGNTQVWGLVGGFVDPAETLEQAAHREVAEEVGLRVTDLVYVDSQGWGNDSADVLLAAYTARSLDPGAEPVVDGKELAEARFFPCDDLPTPTPAAHLIAGRLLAHLTTPGGAQPR